MILILAVVTGIIGVVAVDRTVSQHGNPKEK